MSSWLKARKKDVDARDKRGHDAGRGGSVSSEHALGRTPVNWKRPFPGLLICMQGCGLIPPHHIITKVDESQSDEFRDIQYLHVAETGKAAADAGKKRPNGNEDVAEETGSSPLLGEILDRLINTAAKNKNEGPKPEQAQKPPPPPPANHPPTSPG